MRVFGWFLGDNDLDQPLVDVETGGCRDGLHPDRANENRGGESVVCYLLSLAEIRHLAHQHLRSAKAGRHARPCRAYPRIRSVNPIEASVSQMSSLNRQTLHLRPDPARVLVRPFRPATEPRDLNPLDKTRANHIVDRVLGLDQDTAASQLAEVLENFEGRHRNLLATFEARADDMEVALASHTVFTRLQRQLVGAYFLHEYSFEASALFNPSIVAHPDQAGVPDGCCRFILSLRAVGEGHISSLAFRSGLIAADGNVTVDPSARLASLPRVRNRTSGPNGDVVEVVFETNEDISERVIFPITEAQSNGIEDARFVEFDDGDTKTFYATYTAYSGGAIRSELMETVDFL